MQTQKPVEAAGGSVQQQTKEEEEGQKPKKKHTIENGENVLRQRECA